MSKIEQQRNFVCLFCTFGLMTRFVGRPILRSFRKFPSSQQRSDRFRVLFRKNPVFQIWSGRLVGIFEFLIIQAFYSFRFTKKNVNLINVRIRVYGIPTLLIIISFQIPSLDGISPTLLASSVLGEKLFIQRIVCHPSHYDEKLIENCPYFTETLTFLHSSRLRRHLRKI